MSKSGKKKSNIGKLTIYFLNEKKSKNFKTTITLTEIASRFEAIETIRDICESGNLKPKCAYFNGRILFVNTEK